MVHPRPLRSSLFAFAVASAAMLAPARAADANHATLSPQLAAELAAARPDQLIDIVAVFGDQASELEIAFAAQGKAGEERRAAVRNALEPRAAAAQAYLVQRLARAQAEGRAIVRRHPLWIVNALAAKATPDLVREIAARPEVERVDVVHHDVQLFGGPDAACVDPGSAADPLAPSATLECGVSNMHAPEVWNTLGDRGEGVVIALVDSGACYTHADIKNHIWVNPGEDLNHDGVVMDAADKNGIDDDGDGFVDDLIGWDYFDEDNDPNDIDGHGSHIAGTLVGDGTSGRQTGMAPGAKVMVLRIGFANETDDVDIWTALQYAASKGANVASMSFGAYHSSNPDRYTWRRLIDNLNAMGLITVIATGNAGSSNPPDDVATPGDVPAAISVGAVDCADVIASYSSQGPSTWQTAAPYYDYPYPPGLRTPSVSGPGTGTWSLDLCSGYTTMSGTSMATPHVAGAAALVLGRKLDTSQAEMKQLLETTATDLGDPGWDRAYGYGRVDALAAASAVSGWVNFRSYRLLDPAPQQGNGDGAADPNELLTLPVTLHNSRAAGAVTAISAVLSSSTAGVAVHDNVAYFPDLAAGTSAESLAPHFSFTAPATCGGYAAFDITVRYDNGELTHGNFLVPIGNDQDVTVFADDFETDKGWTTTGTTATAGAFVREDPHQSKTAAGDITQTEDDHSAAGTKCMVTGNHYPIPSSESDDVDGGIAMILSPRINLTGWPAGRVEYWYYTYLGGQGFRDLDLVRFEWSNDDGATWTIVEELAYPGRRHWAKSGFTLNLLPVTDRMRFRMKVYDQGFDSTVDGMLDDITITGTHRVCDSWSAPSAKAPNGVGATLRLARAGADVRLEWQAPASDGGHDAATLYRVRRGDTANGALTEIGSATVTWHADAGEWHSAAPIRFYDVRAENAGGTEAP